LPLLPHADIDAAFPDRDAAVDHVAAGVIALGAPDAGIELPQLLAGLGVEGDDLDQAVVV